MTTTADMTSAVIEAFATRGFRYAVRTAAGRFVLKGPLLTHDGPHASEITLLSDFSAPPQIRLLQVPQKLKPIAPHINSDGVLCYLAKSSIAINIFDPVGQMIACLERAEKVLDQLLKHELVADLAEEFFAYWGEYSCHCFFDVQVNNQPHKKTITNLKCMMDVRIDDRRARVFITDDVNRTIVKSKMLGYDAHDLTLPVFRIFTKAVPRPRQDRWPPETLGEMLTWQALLEPRASRKIEERVIQTAEKGQRGAVIMVQSPCFLYAFMVFFNPQNRKPYSKIELRKKTILNSAATFPLHSWRIDEHYITQRNIPHMKTLANKRIALIGCGTIGGYLADMLVKAGAGADQGELVLVDNDLLMASNLGRHRLGFPAIHKNKATALMNELKNCAPDANLRTLPVDVRESNLAKLDLLINATGEQTISDFLAVTHSRIPQLSIWIEGPGTAVRGLLRAKLGGACFQCLSIYNRNGQYHSTEEKLPQIYAGQGCEQEYVPFPATVAIHAACLASEMTMEWVNGVEAPTLQTRVLDRTFHAATPDCVPACLPECPACSI